MMTNMSFVDTLHTSMNLGTEEKKETPLEPNPDSTPEISIDTKKPDVRLEPMHQEYYDSSYTCLVIPRLPAHELVGDIKGPLPGWMQQVCVSFEWRLEFVVVEPNYLQWGIRVPPTMSPGQFMSILRKETSDIIMTTFPRLKAENADPDFWAPGYLVTNGLRHHPQDLINQYVLFSRRQQGFGK